MKVKEDLSGLTIDKAVRSTAKRKFPRLRRKSTLLIGSALVMAVIVGAVLMPSTKVQVATVSQSYPSQALSILNASGYVVAQRKSSVAAKVTGRLIELKVEEGSRIKEGEIIARLENEDVKAAKVQAEANLIVSRNALEQSRAELKDAGTNFRRARDLVQRGFISKSEFDTAEARYLKAVAGMAAAEGSVKAGAAAVESSRIAVEYTLIRAPFDAVVLTKNADIGDIITPIGAAANAKSAVVTIADMNSLLVEADVSEANVSRIRRGQPCEIQLDAVQDRRFRGQVHMIVPTADRNKASIMVKVSFKDRDPRVLPDMSARVSFLSREIKEEEGKPLTAAPRQAVVQKGSRPVVYLVEGKKVREVPVETGIQIGEMVEIRTGAKTGDKVVVRPVEEMKDGMEIKVVEK